MSTPETPSLAEWLEAEPFTLAMSSGFCGFYAHAGALSALAERDLTPIATRGSSAGALVTGLWASGMEPDRIQKELFAVRREDFWDPSFGPGLLKGDLFEEKLREMVDGQQIEDLEVPVNISVTDLYTRRPEVIRTGDLARVMHASCAFPLLMQPVRIDGRLKLDGGFKDHPGLAEALTDERLFFHNLLSRGLRSKLDRGDAEALAGRSNIGILEISGIPKVRPTSLHQGREAFHYTKERVQQALSMPVVGQVS